MLIVSTAIVALPLASGAEAQTQAAPETQAAQPQLEEIVVTAEKRSEKLSKVPISIMAITEDQLDKQGVKDVQDIARLVPGLELRASDELGNTNISIRGITSDTGSETTGVYIDDTPVQARQEIVSSNPYPRVFDLDHVEVLRGPQGTLFGAGSEGGTIRFLTPEPSLETFSGNARTEFSGTVGGDPSYEFGGALGGPIVQDKVGFRASLWYRSDGGYIDRINPVTGQTAQDSANGEDATVARVAFKFAPTDNLIITPAVFYQDSHKEDRDFYWEVAGPFKEYAQIPQPHSDSYTLPSFTVEYDFAAFSVKSITSYFNRAVTDKFDATSFELSGLLPDSGITLPGDPKYLSIGEYQQNQLNWTEELRFTSNSDTDDRFSWVAGFYYQHNRSGSASEYIEPFNKVADYLSKYYGYGPGNSLSYFGEAPVDGIYSYLQNIIVRETDKAAFGNLTYKITDDLKAAVGLRVAVSGFDYNDFQDGPYGPAAPTRYSGGIKETPVTPKFNLSYQIDPDQMVYVTAAKGYRIGGANESLLGVVSCASDLAALHLKDVPPTFNSDSVWSYEAGAKGKFFDNTVRIDASIFWINWSGIQQEVYLPDCGYYYTANLGSAVSRGFDLQAEWVVGSGFTLSGTAGLTDTRFDSTITESGNILAKSGDSLATPEWTATLAAQYDFHIRDETGAYARVDYQFAGPYYRTGSADTYSYNPNTRNAPATHYVTLRAGVTQDGWDISTFIDNALNSRTSLYRYQDTVNSPGLRDITFRPLTVGLTAAYKY
jgi:outer membrane receptor protein involved in Fe transport